MSEMPEFNPNLGDQKAYDDLAEKRAEAADAQAQRQKERIADLTAQGGVAAESVQFRTEAEPATEDKPDKSDESVAA